MSKVVKVDFVDSVHTESRSIPARQPAFPGHGGVSELDPHQTLLDAQDTLARAEREAAAIVDQACARAEAIRAEAEVTAGHLYQAEREKGQRDGYADGHAQALLEAEATCQTLFSKAEQVVTNADKHRVELMTSLADSLTYIVMTAVRNLLHRELDADGPDVKVMVQSLLSYVTESSRVEVRVHPDDYAAATAAHPIWQSQKFGEWAVAVVPDGAMTRGGCELRSDVGRVDARIETKLAMLHETIADFMERRASEFVHTMESARG